jgi:anti-sigma B factor antagonist
VSERLIDRPFRAKLTRPADNIAVVALTGEIDLFTAPEFQERLLQGVEAGARRVVVDLSEVTFLDSTALGVLVAGAKLLPHDGELLIVCSGDGVARILEIVGFDRVFAIHPTLDEALVAAKRLASQTTKANSAAVSLQAR